MNLSLSSITSWRQTFWWGCHTVVLSTVVPNLIPGGNRCGLRSFCWALHSHGLNRSNATKIWSRTFRFSTGRWFSVDPVQRRRWFLANGKLNLEVWDLHLQKCWATADCWWLLVICGLFQRVGFRIYGPQKLMSWCESSVSPATKKKRLWLGLPRWPQ